jgi:D-3-phosphoglycerate dehydrogenase
MKVFLTQDIAQAGKDYLTERGYELVLATGGDEETLCREIGDADAILARTQIITDRVLEHAVNVKVIGRHGTGTDNIDLDAARKRNIRVTNGPESNAEAVAEHVAALVLALAYQVPMLDRAVRDGRWDARNHVFLTELPELTFGVIGFGRIGSRAAEILHDAFHMKILAWSRSLHTRKVPEYVTVTDSMETLLKYSDFAALCCSAGADNFHMIDRNALLLMKPSSYLINCARGSLVDEAALYEALTGGTISGAALDCLEEEPPAPDNPLLLLPNVIFSPHCSSHTPESMERMAVHAAMGIDEVLTGKPVSWPVI